MKSEWITECQHTQQVGWHNDSAECSFWPLKLWNQWIWENLENVYCGKTIHSLREFYTKPLIFKSTSPWTFWSIHRRVGPLHWPTLKVPRQLSVLGSLNWFLWYTRSWKRTEEFKDILESAMYKCLPDSIMLLYFQQHLQYYTSSLPFYLYECLKFIF